MPTTTPRLGMQVFAGSDLVSNIDTIDQQAKPIIDTLAVDQQGTHAARPAANSVPVGTYYTETDTKSTYRSDGSNWNSLSAPTGVIMQYAAASAPSGWLLCDGSAVSRTTNATLFGIIGTTYGAGNGSTTFNVPDLRGRVAVGVDGSAGRLAANDALGNSSGEEKHALTSGENGAHTHGLLVDNGAGAVANVLALAQNRTGLLDPGYDASSGSGTAHNNMQPFLIVQHIIKT